jgi:hypothetical protein
MIAIHMLPNLTFPSPANLSVDYLHLERLLWVTLTLPSWFSSLTTNSPVPFDSHHCSNQPPNEGVLQIFISYIILLKQSHLLPFIYLFIYFAVLGFEPQDLHLEPLHQPFLLVGFFQDRVLKNYLPGLALNRDPPISAS